MLKKIMRVTLLMFILNLHQLNFNCLFAQRFGIQGALGLANSNISDYDAPGSLNKKSILGYQFGPMVDFKLVDKFRLETGILFSSKGYQYNFIFDFSGNGDFAETDQHIRITYLEVPVLVTYKFDSLKIPILIGAGPVLGFGIFGKTEFASSYSGIEYEESSDIVFGNEAEEFKRIDLGFLLKAGISLKNTDISLFYNIGLSNVLNEGTMKNRLLGISVSQWLLRKEK